VFTSHLSELCDVCVVAGFVQFIQKDIADTNGQQVDSSLRLLMQLISKYNTQKVYIAVIIISELIMSFKGNKCCELIAK